MTNNNKQGATTSEESECHSIDTQRYLCKRYLKCITMSLLPEAIVEETGNGTAAVSLVGGCGTNVKLKGTDGTLVLNRTFNMGSTPDAAVFKMKDGEGDNIVVESFAHICKGYTILYKDTVYVCVRAIPPQTQIGTDSPNDTQTNTERQKKAKISFPVEELMVNPSDFRPPVLDTASPEFVCSNDWLTSMKLTIDSELHESDVQNGKKNIQPMAVVRCSRGGKTRALKEIANMDLTYGEEAEPVKTIFVSFNEYSELDYEDQADPLRALLLRIAFEGQKSRHENTKGSTDVEKFREFRKTKYTFSQSDILEWLGETPALLLIDELNNLEELTLLQSEKATAFARFVKDFFLSPCGRYFIFSTHVLSTLECLGEYMDPPAASERYVIVQDLPLVDNLTTAKVLKSNLRGAREAIYYGLMPGLIFTQGTKPQNAVAIKRQRQVNRYNRETSSERRTRGFIAILKSLILGKISDHDFPVHFHALLDASSSPSGSELVNWAPYHLEFVLDNLQVDDASYNMIKSSMAQLCKQILESKECSGDGWEALFVLFLLARFLTSSWIDPILPELAFESSTKPVVHFNEALQDTVLDHCVNWNDLKAGFLPKKRPTISLFYPSFAMFEAYDVIAIFSENSKMNHILGYQLKEGKQNATMKPENFFRSIVVKGTPPRKTTPQKSNWMVAGEDDINDFFGVSGKHWTPQEWKKLNATAEKPRASHVKESKRKQQVASNAK